MGIPHTFSNCVRATFNQGLTPSQLDWGDPKGEPTKHGLSLMEVDWERKIYSYTHVDACSWKLTGEANSSSTTHQMGVHAHGC